MFSKDILCSFSGGGFRATFFHAGVLRGLIRLGLKEKIKVISSVSGGSITNALFGIKFDQISNVKDFDDLVLIPLRDFSKRDLRNKLVKYRVLNSVNSVIDGIGSLLGPLGKPFSLFGGKKNSSLFMENLDEHLFQRHTMRDLSKNLRVVINATNINNGARWRFDNDDFGDYKTGYSYEGQHIPLSFAVMASACYPGLFSPLKMKISNYKFYLRDKYKRNATSPNATSDVVHLSDGGIFDNLGYYSLKSELDRGRDGFLIISDAANRFENTNIEYGFWNSPSRIINVLMEQVSNRDRNKIMDNLKNSTWSGAYFKLDNSCKWYREYNDSNVSLPEDLPLLGWSDATVARISQIRTDLDYFNDLEIKGLVCHGESIVETVLAKWHGALYRQLANTNSHLFALPCECEKDVFNGLEKSHKYL